MTKTDAAVQTLSGINPDVVLEVSNYAQHQYSLLAFFPTSVNQIISLDSEHHYFLVEVTNIGHAVFVELTILNVFYFPLLIHLPLYLYKTRSFCCTVSSLLSLLRAPTWYIVL